MIFSTAYSIRIRSNEKIITAQNESKVNELKGILYFNIKKRIMFHWKSLWGRIQTTVLCLWRGMHSIATAFVLKYNRIVEEKLHKIKYQMSRAMEKIPSIDLTDSKHSKRDSLFYQINRRAWRDVICILLVLRWRLQRIIRNHRKIFTEHQSRTTWFATKHCWIFQQKTDYSNQFNDLSDRETRIYFEINIFRTTFALEQNAAVFN